MKNRATLKREKEIKLTCNRSVLAYFNTFEEPNYVQSAGEHKFTLK